VKAESGHVFCLVLVDVFSGFIVLRPLKDKKATTIAGELWDVFCTLGVPKVLQSDNGTEFCNETLRALNKLIGVPHRFISEYNPRADGKVERVVRTVKQTVMKLLHGASIFWPLHLPFVQLSYNDKVQSLTASTPFSLMFGRAPNTLKSYTADAVTGLPTDLADWKKHQEEVVSLILPAVSKRINDEQAKYRARLDKTRAQLTTLDIPKGSSVMIKDPKYLLNPGMRPSHEPMYIGPYTVVRQSKYGPYVLRDETGELLDRNVPLDQIKVRLSPARPYQRAPRPSAAAAAGSSVDSAAADSMAGDHTDGDDENDDDVYEVEKIMSHRHDDDGLAYHVKWKGYPLSESTWVKETEFVDTAIIHRYLREAAMKNEGKRATRGRASRLHAISLVSFPIPDQ
jgi:hypothetical protein